MFFASAVRSPFLDKRNLVYGQTVAGTPAGCRSLRRLTVFYALRLPVSTCYADATRQLADWQYGSRLPSARRSITHFLPTLFCLVLFYPVMRSATRYPIVGPASSAPSPRWIVTGWLGQRPGPDACDYLLRFTKTLGYVGYGFAAFSLTASAANPPGRPALLFRLGTFAAMPSA